MLCCFRAFDSVALVLGLKQLGSSIDSGNPSDKSPPLPSSTRLCSDVRATVPLSLSSVRRATQLHGCSGTGLLDSAMLFLPIDFHSSTSGTTYFESLGSGWRLMDEGDGEERIVPAKRNGI